MPLYHGSNHKFDSFDFSMGGRTDRASNGALGVWVTDDYNIASKFGGYVYHLDDALLVEKIISLRTLIDWHESVRGDHDEDDYAFYESLRANYVAEGYTLLSIQEKDGSKPTRVILTPEAINIIQVDEPGVSHEPR